MQNMKLQKVRAWTVFQNTKLAGISQRAWTPSYNRPPARGLKARSESKATAHASPADGFRDTVVHFCDTPIRRLARS
jgi:hypothetical protein